jgi:hypothetical protein
MPKITSCKALGPNIDSILIYKLLIKDTVCVFFSFFFNQIKYNDINHYPYMVTSYPAMANSCADDNPAIPAPKIPTDFFMLYIFDN